MKYFLPFLIIFFSPLTISAAEYFGECSISFQASATLHDFQGSGQCEPFIVNEDQGVLTIPEVKVPVASLDTGNAKRDQQMREMFEADHYPVITGRSGAVSLSVVRQALADPDAAIPDIPVQLEIRDIERQIIAEMKEFSEGQDKIQAVLEFPVSLADYQLEPPSLLGIIRVGDRIEVKADFILQAR